MNHSFDIDEAKEYGIEEAIIVQHFRFWIIKNRADESHFHDGRYWTFATVESLTEIFPYLSYKQLRRAIFHLEDLGVIQSGSYNKLAYDKTKWYSFVDEASFIPSRDCPNGQKGLPKRAIGSAQTGKPIPYSPTYSPTDKDSVSLSEEEIPEGFDPASINLEEAIFGHKREAT